MMKHPDVIKNPEPMVTVGEIDDDAIILNLFPRIEIKPFDAQNPRELERAYYSVYFGVQELVKTAFQKNNIEGPSESIEIVK